MQFEYVYIVKICVFQAVLMHLVNGNYRYSAIMSLVLDVSTDTIGADAHTTQKKVQHVHHTRKNVGGSIISLQLITRYTRNTSRPMSECIEYELTQKSKYKGSSQWHQRKFKVGGTKRRRGEVWGGVFLAYYIPRLSRASLCVSWAFLFKLVQSAVLRLHVVCPSVCNVGGLGSHRH